MKILGQHLLINNRRWFWFSTRQCLARPIYALLEAIVLSSPHTAKVQHLS